MSLAASRFDVAYHWRQARLAWRKAWDARAHDLAMRILRVRQILFATPLERLAQAARIYRDASAARGVAWESAFSAASHAVTCRLAHGFNAGGTGARPLAVFARAVDAYAATGAADLEKALQQLRVVFRAPSPADVAAGMVV